MEFPFAFATVYRIGNFHSVASIQVWVVERPGFGMSSPDPEVIMITVTMIMITTIMIVIMRSMITLPI